MQNAKNAVLRNSTFPKTITIITFTKVSESLAIKIVLLAEAESPPDFAILAMQGVKASTSVITEIEPAIQVPLSPKLLPVNCSSCSLFLLKIALLYQLKNYPDTDISPFRCSKLKSVSLVTSGSISGLNLN